MWPSKDGNNLRDKKQKRWYNYNINKKIKKVHTLKSRYNNYKKGAERKNVVFELTQEDFEKILLQGECFYCGNKVYLNSEFGNYFAGLDKVVPDLGYKKDNIVLCCQTCNFMKCRDSISSFVVQCIKISENMKKKMNNLVEKMLKLKGK